MRESLTEPLTCAEFARMRCDAAALAISRRYFDAAMYALVDFRLCMEAPVSPTGFPRFEALEAAIGHVDVRHRVLARLFRLGQTIEDAVVAAAIPSGALDAFATTGLLERAEGGWRTPGLVLVPIEGLLVFAGVPPSYPTARKPSDVWFDLSSFVVARALPRSLDGARVLDVCCGSGVQGLLAASRGAARVVGLDISERAIEVAQLNAIFNAVPGEVIFRRSDKLAALAPGESFDLIVCNTPWAPAIDGGVRSVEDIGNRVFFAMFDELIRRLAPPGRAIAGLWRTPGRAVVPTDLSISAFVDRAPDTVEGVLRMLDPDAAARARELFATAGPELAFYNQIISLERS